MTIPFLDLFKKLTSRFGGGATATEVSTQPAPPVVRPKKPEAERLSKTVMPNATRSFSASDPFRAASSTAVMPRGSMPLELGARKITSSAARPRGAQLPPALARALEPKVERTISLRVVDLVDVVPAGFIKPVEILDTNALVSLKASEIEKGMPDKHPMISLPSLYQQVPEIFLRSVRPDDETRVELPYEKVLAQFLTAHVRSDQVRDLTVPHVDTPILTATIEDSERFGTKVEPIEASAGPPMPIRHATAQSIADAEPDAAPAEPQKAVTSKSSGQKLISLHLPELKSKSDTPEPSPAEPEIPFELSPNGTGASASERVPASSGPPVPTPLPFTPELEKIPLQPPPEKPVTSPPSKLPVTEPVTRPMKTTVGGPVKPPPAETITESPISLPPVVSASAKEAPSMSFSLKPLLQNLPAFQLNGDIAAVSEDARITLPLALIEPQLASGRVSIAPDVFQAALPEEHRGLFQVDVAKTPVALPLEEVLKNLPAAILKLRDDQEEIAHDKDFETPFLAKAREDAKRFTPKPAEKDAGEKKPAAQSKVDIAPEAKSALERVDPKEIVAQVNALNGIKACAITFSDGLSLAGELPEKIKADGLCAMAPSVLERIAQHVRGTKLGQLVAMTLYASDSAVSFFAKGSVCLTALHEGSLGPETRARLAHLVEKLSKTYAQPESSNVDH
jgi:predicted regulator of Ras-like GTPase activity (Roadblock/LC7/MglB family)